MDNQDKVELKAGQAPQPEKTQQPLTLHDQLQQIMANSRMEFATKMAQNGEVARSIMEGTCGQLAAICLQQDGIIQNQHKLFVELKMKIEKLEKELKETKSRR